MKLLIFAYAPVVLQRSPDNWAVGSEEKHESMTPTEIWTGYLRNKSRQGCCIVGMKLVHAVKVYEKHWESTYLRTVVYKST